MENIKKIIDVAMGDQQGDLLLKNCNIVNVFSSDIEQGNIVITDRKIAGIGDYDNANNVIDIKGAHVCPGFIDSHVHIESSMLTPFEFARAVGPLGVTSAIVDPHEIANVLGQIGIKFMLESSKNNHISLYFMLPSCVPATDLETSGATLLAKDIEPFIKEKWVTGLGEVMNYPGVIAKNADLLKKVEISKMKRVDGHAPGLSGRKLNSYIAAGISTDHECVTAEEAREKLARGMKILVREGSVAKNLKELVSIVTPENSDRFMLCTDDRHPEDLLNGEYINHSIKMAIKEGLDPIQAIKMATINVAEHYKIPRKGAVVPGYWADLVVFDNFKNFDIEMVFRSGEIIAENYQFIGKPRNRHVVKLRGTVNVGSFKKSKLKIPDKDKKIRVMELIKDQIITTYSIHNPQNTQKGYIESDIKTDILKIAVVERHLATGNMGMGFVKGFGLKRGAIASTVAHDSHNIIVIGTNDEDMEFAVRELIDSQGGKIVVEECTKKAILPLPIGGLMSRKGVREVAKEKITLQKECKKLGCTLDNPFMAMSFLTLPVIPELKISDLGLIDVNNCEIVDLYI